LSFNMPHKIISLNDDIYITRGKPTVCVSRWWAGWDSAGEQEKLEARKMLVSRDESHQSAARFVRPRHCFTLYLILQEP
jgi:hypothetical protein